MVNSDRKKDTMEKYILFRGKITGKRYDFDKNAHYHIEAVGENEVGMYDIAVNIGNVTEYNERIYSSNLRVYYDEDYKYNRKILNEMLIQKKGITEGRRGLNLDYVKMKLFPFENMKLMRGLDKEKIFLTEIIEKNVLEGMYNDDIEVFAFGREYSSKNGMHDIHMNQGSRGRHKEKDRAYSDGGLFFYNRKENKWTALFIAFLNQKFKTNRNGKVIYVR